MTSLAGETKDSELLVSGLYPPGPATARATPSRFETSPDGTLLIYPQGKNIVVRVSVFFLYQCPQFSSAWSVGLGQAKICPAKPLWFFILLLLSHLSNFLIFSPHDFSFYSPSKNPTKVSFFKDTKQPRRPPDFPPTANLLPVATVLVSSKYGLGPKQAMPLKKKSKSWANV